MDARIRWALAEVERNVSRVTVPELAAAVNLSPSRFAHLFAREVGTSPARYLRLRRLDYARELLETTFLSVKEILARVGLNDASHFTRYFRQCHGLPPRQWRVAVHAAKLKDVELAGFNNE